MKIPKIPALLSFIVIIFALLLSSCGAATAAPTFPPFQDTPALDTSPTSAPVLPTEPQQPSGGPTATIEIPPTPLPTETPTPHPTETIAVSGTQESCTDKATFVDDVTVEDDTEFLPGEKFTKTWRLRNNGTCTWTKDYSLVFAKGEQMSGASPSPLAGDVAPGQTVDVSVELVAPSKVGTYRGDWQLRNKAGDDFGLGQNSDKTFYVQIVVAASTSELNLGSPDWKDTFNNGASWYMVETDNTSFEVDDGQLKMTAKETGAAEEWGISNRPGVADFYLEGTFKTGDACAGLDRYGFLVRAPDPNQGYVFSFSCDGRYRVYKWDGENYKGIVEWRTSASIKSGAGQTNRLGVWAKGSQFKFYANGRLLVEFEDDTYDEGQFGLLIGSSKTEDLQVFVEEVSFWNLE